MFHLTSFPLCIHNQEVRNFVLNHFFYWRNIQSTSTRKRKQEPDMSNLHVSPGKLVLCLTGFLRCPWSKAVVLQLLADKGTWTGHCLLTEREIQGWASRDNWGSCIHISFEQHFTEMQSIIESVFLCKSLFCLKHVRTEACMTVLCCPGSWTSFFLVSRKFLMLSNVLFKKWLIKQQNRKC